MLDSVESFLEVKEDYRVHIAVIDIVCPVISSLKKSSDFRVEASNPDWQLESILLLVKNA